MPSEADFQNVAFAPEFPVFHVFSKSITYSMIALSTASASRFIFNFDRTSKELSGQKKFF